MSFYDSDDESLCFSDYGSESCDEETLEKWRDKLNCNEDDILHVAVSSGNNDAFQELIGIFANTPDLYDTNQDGENIVSLMRESQWQLWDSLISSVIASDINKLIQDISEEHLAYVCESCIIDHRYDVLERIISCRPNEFKSVENNPNDAHFVNWARKLSQSSAVKQQGRLPALMLDRIRYYRSYRTTRARQVLRHVASQLFHAACHQDLLHNPVEVEALFFCNNLFIASNYDDTAKCLYHLVQSNGLKDILITPYQPPSSIRTTLLRDEWCRRSKRYARKLRNRVFAEHINLPAADKSVDSQYAKKIAEVLREAQVELLDVTDVVNIDYALSQDKKIFIVSHGKNGLSPRHAEEWLVDIVDRASVFKINSRSIIAGKKRPCVACYSRMRSSVIKDYNSYPGKFWLHTIEKQPDCIAKETLCTLVNQAAHESSFYESKDSNAEYDSGSDSEWDDHEPLDEWADFWGAIDQV